MSPKTNSLQQRATALRLHGILEHWSEVSQADWLQSVIAWEEQARAQRSLERRIRAGRIGRFKAMADFDWGWPTKCDRGAIESLMTLEFIKGGANVVLRGPNGVGKSMLARNVAHQALVQGHTVRFTTAGELLGTWPPWTVTVHCAGGCTITLVRICWSLMRLATCRTPTGTPICCSSW